MAQSNISSEHVSADEDEPFAEITKVVTRTIKEKMKEADSIIAEAVRHKMEKQTSTTAAPKRKIPDLRLAGNKKCYETNEEVIESMVVAILHIICWKLDAA